MTRSLPNSSTSPVSTLKGWPASATSSPMRNTRGSRRISSASAAARAHDGPADGRVDELHVLAVDALGVDPEGPGPGEDLAGRRLGAGRVLAVEVVLADVDHRQRPERGHVHRLVQEALAERAVA